MDKLQSKIKYFKERVFFYQKYFSMQNYKYIVVSDNLTGSKASWEVDFMAMRVIIRYDNKWMQNSDIEEINLVAFHEVYESTLTDIYDILIQKYSYNYTMAIIHNNVRLIENTLFNFVKDLK